MKVGWGGWVNFLKAFKVSRCTCTSHLLAKAPDVQAKYNNIIW